ncbi:hypothetical protein DFJ73DRAFT_900624 [Zopfochytrium polystomum]|nr:hypothetical protein DFJ73DRAFT_900624 [Zopfochytrium polystomum]
MGPFRLPPSTLLKNSGVRAPKLPGALFGVHAAAIQDHIVGAHASTSIPRSLVLQRQKWKREAAQKLPKLSPSSKKLQAAAAEQETHWRSLLASQDEVVRRETTRRLPSLAQRLGLVEPIRSTQPSLSASDWSRAKEAAKKRYYEALTTWDAAVSQLHLCATKIQAVWRRWRVRKLYVAYRATHVPNEPLLRQRFYVDKLSSVNRYLNQQIEKDSAEVACVLADIDRALKESREAFDELDAYCTEPDWKALTRLVISRSSEQPGQQGQQRPLSEACAICLCQLGTQPQLCLLSCGHVFHGKCIGSFERLSGWMRSTVCPICRSHYQKKFVAREELEA